MDNKKKLIIGSSAVAGLAIVGGAFAIFSDVVIEESKATVGTVDITGSAHMTHQQLSREKLASFLKANNAQDTSALEFEVAPDNINPGDNVPVFESKDDPAKNNNIEIETRPGTDHEMDITINNVGTKSVLTRVMVELSGTTADGNTALTHDQLALLKVYFDKFNSVPGASSIGIEGVSDSQRVMLKEYTRDEANKLIYCFDSHDAAQAVDMTGENTAMGFNLFEPTTDIVKSQMVLSGVGDNAEIEKYKAPDGSIVNCPTQGSFKLDLAMDSSENRDVLQGATIQITVKIEGMQYRNTSNANWETLFTEKLPDIQLS